MKHLLKLFLALFVSFSIVYTQTPSIVLANEATLGSVTEVTVQGNVVKITYSNGQKGQIKFLEDDIFRFTVDPNGDFYEYAKPSQGYPEAKIQQQPDSSAEYTKPTPQLSKENDKYVLTTGKAILEIDKATSKLTLKDKNSKVLFTEVSPLSVGTRTYQTLSKAENEHYFGGGTQNGRYIHTNKSIAIKNTNNWVDGGVASPNPFYYTTNGYGVLRNTFKPGVYDFGFKDANQVVTTHEDGRFDAYYFVGSTPKAILNNYYKVTGKPVVFHINSYYVGHLNCYNRDEWVNGTRIRLENGNTYNEINNKGLIKSGGTLETLNNQDPFSARAVIDGYVNNDMPFGWFLPNDGYGCGYGTHGFNQVSSDPTSNIDKNVANLKAFTDYASQFGIITGLWTQSNLSPVKGEKDHLQRDFAKEVNNGGIKILKTDVAWVGPGYSFGLNGIHGAYDIIGANNERPTIITLDGWAGTQRFGGIWTGDQTGGNWEYIRFHIPTYIGQSLSGNPNVGSDMDGIFGGSNVITARDYQWKTFTPLLLNMDGWGSYPKKPYYFGDDITSINRMYLKLRSELLPYFYNEAYKSMDDLPMMRAMFLNYPNDPYAYSLNLQYQFMFGNDFLVAPIYKNTAMNSATGDDIRNNIYLPEPGKIWIDYFTGQQYKGGSTINNFDAPIWKLPLFVRNGAIVPMYEENNNAFAPTTTNVKGLDRTKRVIEFWPDGSTSYELLEDDGVSLNNTNKEEPTYGPNVKTRFTSEVVGDVATLTAHPSTGNYNGYDSNRVTTFIVNVSEHPTSVTDGTTPIKEVNSLEEFKNATETVYFYNSKYNLNKYGTGTFKDKEIITNPKLMVKFARADVNQTAQTVVVNGFKNEAEFDKDVLNPALTVPTNFIVDTDKLTPTSITLKWDTVDQATKYDVEVDGILNRNITATTFIHLEQPFDTPHKYRVRAVNKDGYSQWSDYVNARTLLDPYRNIPENMSVIWNHGDRWGAKEQAIDKDPKSMFHSSSQTDKPVILDMKMVYDLEKFVYIARENAGNGTVQKATIETSLDGVHWKTLYNKDERWNLSTSNLTKEFLPSEKTLARYIRLTPIQTVGGFLSAAELQPYKVDGTDAYAVADGNGDGVIDQNDLTFYENYHGLITSDSDWSYVVDKGSDIDYNNIIDAYDLSFVTTNLEGGTKQQGNASGKIVLIPSKTNVTTGEVYELKVMGVNLRAVNAYTVRLNLTDKHAQFVEFDHSFVTRSMKPFVSDKNRQDGTNDFVLTQANIGNKPLISGNVLLGTIKLKALQDGPVLLDNTAKLVGPKLNVVDATSVEPTFPSIEGERFYQASDFSAIHITNDQLPNDDGNNYKLLAQGQTNPNVLLDGVKTGSQFEFRWYYGTETDAQFPAYIKIPSTFSFHLNQPGKVNSVTLYGRNGGNGTVKKAKVVLVDESNNEHDLGELTSTNAVFNFTFDQSINMKRIDVTPLETTGNASKLSQPTNRMITINEVTIGYNANTDVTAVNILTDLSNLYVGDVVELDVDVQPEQASNKYVKITSDNDSVKIVTSKEGDQFKYYATAIQPGSANLTISSVSNPTVTNTAVATVHAGANKQALNNLIAQLASVIDTEDLYEATTFEPFKEAYTQASTTANDDSVAQEAVNQAYDKLLEAYNALRFLPAIEANKLEGVTNLPTENEMTAATGEDAELRYTLDGQNDTYWHSKWTIPANNKLPQEITYDLGKTVTLTDIKLLARQNSRNGDFKKFEVYTSTDNTDYALAGSFELEHNGTQLVNKDQFYHVKFKPAAAQYVRIKVLESFANFPQDNNKFATLAEIQFFAEKEKVTVHFDTDGGSEIQDVQVTIDTPLTRPENPTKADHDFVEWQKDGAPYDFATPVTEAMTLKAIWQEKAKVHVIFNLNNGSASPDMEVYVGSILDRPTDPQKDGYVFVEWQKDGVVYNFDTPVTEDITLEAIYRPENAVTFTVTFDSNGGSAIPAQTVNANATANKPQDPTRDGYTFVGWTLDDVDYTFTEAVDRNITLVAKWNAIALVDPVTVTFDTDGGTSLTPVQVERGSKVNKPSDPSKPHHTFVKWVKEDVDYTFEETVEEDITLKAIWQEDEKVTVTFDTQGGNAIAPVEVYKHEMITPVTPTRTHFTFTGWTYNNQPFTFTTPIETNMTLVATWQEHTKFTVTFNTDGGNAIESKMVYTGETVQQPENPTKLGYKFVEWKLDTVSYDFTNPVVDNITLKAIWQPIAYVSHPSVASFTLPSSLDGKQVETFDIYVTEAGSNVKIQPEVEVEVILTLANGSDNVTVYHVNADNTLTAYPHEVLDANRIKFKSKDFSPYVVVKNTITPPVVQPKPPVVKPEASTNTCEAKGLVWSQEANACVSKTATPKANPSVPKTGDTTNVTFYTMMLLTSFLALGYFVIRKNRKVRQ